MEKKQKEKRKSEKKNGDLRSPNVSKSIEKRYMFY